MRFTRLYLLRHGQVVGFEEKRYNGQGNVSLTKLGKQQASCVDAALRSTPISAVYSSDLDRSLYSAALIADTHGLDVSPEKSLRELNVGIWEGLTWANLQEKYPDDWQARINDIVNFRIPEGESLQDAASRIRPAINQILKKHPAEDVVVVAHGGVNRIILLDALGADLSRVFSVEQDFGCINVVDYYEDGSAIVKLLNSTSHCDSAADEKYLARRPDCFRVDTSST